jgi:hypothetical protein
LYLPGNANLPIGGLRHARLGGEIGVPGMQSPWFVAIVNSVLSPSSRFSEKSELNDLSGVPEGRQIVAHREAVGWRPSHAKKPRQGRHIALPNEAFALSAYFVLLPLPG